MVQDRNIAVIGCGLMGSGIAEVTARAGLETVVVELDEGALVRGKDRIRASFDRAVTTKKLDENDAGAALNRLTFTSDLDAVAKCDVVLEAIAEIENLKLELYSSLDRIVESPEAVFGSNTSSIPIARIASATERPQQVLGVHFFNPVPVMSLVEITPSILTANSAIEIVEDLVTKSLGKVVIRSTDRAGFVVNGLLIPYILNAIRMLEGGFADEYAIDTGMEQGCGVPMGPLRLADFIGLDTLKFIADAMYEEFKEPFFTAPSLLMRMVEANLLGKKTGKGFYEYEA